MIAIIVINEMAKTAMMRDKLCRCAILQVLCPVCCLDLSVNPLSYTCTQVLLVIPPGDKNHSGFDRLAHPKSFN